jgi:hypothetical protein
MRAPVAYEPVKKMPSTGWRSRAAPDLARADDGNEHVVGNAAGVQEVRDVLAGHRRVLRRLVEDGVARDERRHEHVAADEVRVIPRGDVRDHAERLVRDALLHRVVGEHLLVAQRARGGLEEEIEAGHEALELVARLPDRLAHLQRERAREVLGLLLHRGAEAGDRREALAQRHARPRPVALPAPGRTCRARCASNRPARARAWRRSRD